MPVEVRISINSHSIGSLVICRTAPRGNLDQHEGVGTYTATLQLEGTDQSITVAGIKHVRADGAVSLIRRALNQMYGWESMGR